MTSQQGIERRAREREAENLRRVQRENDLSVGVFTEPRSWAARTKDEIASWFGDTNAMRRRQWDEAAGDHTGKGPAQDVNEDARIMETVNHRLTVDRLIDASGVRASCEDGRVTLDGVVPTGATAQRAESLASAVHGVKEVVNNLEVA